MGQSVEDGSAQPLCGTGGGRAGGGCVPGDAIWASRNAEDAYRCASAFLPWKSARLLELAERDWVVGLLDAFRRRPDFHPRAEVILFDSNCARRFATPAV